MVSGCRGTDLIWKVLFNSQIFPGLVSISDLNRGTCAFFLYTRISEKCMFLAYILLRTKQPKMIVFNLLINNIRRGPCHM